MPNCTFQEDTYEYLPHAGRLVKSKDVSIVFTPYFCPCRLNGETKHKTKHKINEQTFRVLGENEDRVQTQDTRDNQNLKSKTRTSQHPSRWSTSTDVPSSWGRDGAQP